MSESLAIIGAKGKGGGSYRAAVEDPNTLQSKSIVTIVDVLSEGEIQGLDGYLQGQPGVGIYLNDTPLITSNFISSFPDVQYEVRYGLPDQDPLPYPAAEAEIDVSTEVTHDYPKNSGAGSGSVTRTITNPNVTSVRVKVQYAGLTEQDKVTGDLHGTDISISILLNGSEVITDEIDEKTTSTYERAYKFNLVGDAPWDITVVRNTEDNDDAAINNDTFWSSYTEIIDAKLVYPDTALVMIRGDAETFGNSVPTRKYLIYGTKVNVPSNYDPTTRSYDGIWDGTFKQAWTDNPAWCYYDLLTNTRYGVGNEVVLTEDTKFQLYQIAQYCDEYVSDGYGGAEPRFTFNYTITSRDDAIEVLRAIASVFRGFAFWGAGSVVVRADRPTEPVRIVTNSNVVDGEFRYSSTAYSDRHSVATVSWYDPEELYSTARELVEDPDLIDRYGWKPLEITAYGCTSRSQAHRLGKWHLLTEQLENETVTYTAGLDHFDIIPGDIILISDERYVNVRKGGRLRGISTSQVHLDQPFTIESGKSYTIHITMPDLTIAERTLVSPVGTFDTFTLGEYLPELPIANAEWIITSTDDEEKQYRVISKTEPEEGQFCITALRYAPEKYDLVETITSYDPPKPSFVKKEIAPPANLTMVESVYWSNGLPYSRITTSWTASRDPLVAGYNVQIEYPDGSTQSREFTKICTFDLDNVAQGVHTIRVQCAASDGRTSTWITQTLDIQGKIIPPGKCTGLTAEGWFGSIRLNWKNPSDTDLSHIQIWENSIDDLSSAVNIDDIKGTTYLRYLGSFQGRYYWVRAVDIAGNVGEFNSESGTYGYSDQEEHQDLVDEILKDELVQEAIKDLNTPIDSLSENGILRSLAEYTDSIADSLRQRQQEQIAESAINSTLTNYVDMKWSLASIKEETIIREEKDEALASKLLTISTMIGDPSNPGEGTIYAALAAEQTARATKDEAQAQDITALQASIGDPWNPTDGTIYAAIKDEKTARASSDEALSETIDSVVASIGDPLHPSVNTVYAAIKEETSARVAANEATANDITTLQTSVDGNTSSVQVLSSSINGVKSKYGVRLDTNGYVTGWELIGGTYSGSMVFHVDNFLVGRPGTTNRYPFVIGTVDGVQRVSMDNAFIQDASISYAKIKDAAVGTLKIGANSVTVPEAAQNTSRVQIPVGGETTLVSLSCTGDYGQPRLLVFTASASFGGGWIECDLMRGGTVVQTVVLRSGTTVTQTGAALSWMDTTGGNYLYRVRARCISAAHDHWLEDATLFALTVKR